MASHHGEGDGTASTIPTTIDYNDEHPRDSSSSSVSADTPSASEMELNVPEETVDAVPAATAAAETSTPTTASVSPPAPPPPPASLARPASPAAPATPAAPASPAAPAPPVLPAPPPEPATSTSTSTAATSATAIPNDPTASSSLPIRQSSGLRYRPPSPPLPPIPPEWQDPSARRRQVAPPLPPYPDDWAAAMEDSGSARMQRRRPSAPNQTPTQSSNAGRTDARRSSTAAAASSEPPLPPAPPAPRPPPQEQRQQRQELTLPRWQPDGEVTYCPICFQQFSIFVRKHHCRKCGRVVCNSCSPHRITIPYQYIVLPPGSQPYQLQAVGSWTDPTGDVRFLGGGERVRLCNPCVPDPNTAPPAPSSSAAAAAGSSNRYHSRSFSSANNSTIQGNAAAGGNASTYHFTLPGFGVPQVASSLSPQHAQRSQPFYGSALTTSGALAIHPAAAATTATSPTSSSSAQTRYRHNRLSLPPLSAVMASAQEQHLQLQLQLHQNQQQQLQRQSHSHHRQSHRPPRPQIAEEDECPVCRRELPKRDLPDFEILREAHITECLDTHSRYMGGSPSTRTTAGSSPASTAADASAASTWLPTNAAEASSSTSAPPPPRLTGMFPYRATEKDCVDAAECTICLEDLEVGVPMARLECFCRFHERCIRAWFKDHPGRCPVHQHDNFGY